MKLVLHIVWKDCRRLRWPLALWLLVIALKLGIGFSIVLTGGFAAWSSTSLEGATTGLTGVASLLTIVLTAMLVQDDSLVGTTQFWLTRPISRGRLLAAKLAGWVLLLWLPAVVLSVPWWLTCAFGPRELALAALELLVLQAAVSLPAALVAVLTDTLSRFLVWLLVLLFAIVTLPWAITNLVAGRMPNVNLSPLVTVVWLGIFVLPGIVVIVRQFFRRDWVSSLVWLGVGTLLSITCAVGLVVAVPQLPTAARQAIFARSPWSDWHAERAADLSLKVHSYNAAVPGRGAELKPTWLTTYVEAVGVPSGSLLAGGDNARQTWTWPGGPVVVRDSPWVDSLGRQSGRAIMLALGVSEPARDAETERYWAKQQEEFYAKHSDGEFRKSQQRLRELLRAVPVGVTLNADVLPSMAERMRRAPPAYEAKVNLRLAQPERWLEVPLKPSGWRAHAAHGFRLDAPGATPDRRPVSAAEEGSDQVETARASAELPIVATMPDFLWDRIFVESRWLRDRWREPFFYVVNRAGGDLQRQSIYRTPKVTIASVGILRDTVHPWVPQVRRGDKWMPRDAHWLEGTTLTLVGFREEARFTREVKAERFEAAK